MISSEMTLFVFPPKRKQATAVSWNRTYVFEKSFYTFFIFSRVNIVSIYVERKKHNCRTYFQYMLNGILTNVVRKKTRDEYEQRRI